MRALRGTFSRRESIDGVRQVETRHSDGAVKPKGYVHDDKIPTEATHTRSHTGLLLEIAMYLNDEIVEHLLHRASSLGSKSADQEVYMPPSKMNTERVIKPFKTSLCCTRNNPTAGRARPGGLDIFPLQSQNGIRNQRHPAWLLDFSSLISAVATWQCSWMSRCDVRDGVCGGEQR
jgi:hypothetical protein